MKQQAIHPFRQICCLFRNTGVLEGKYLLIATLIEHIMSPKYSNACKLFYDWLYRFCCSLLFLYSCLNEAWLGKGVNLLLNNSNKRIHNKTQRFFLTHLEKNPGGHRWDWGFNNDYITTLVLYLYYLPLTPLIFPEPLSSLWLYTCTLRAPTKVCKSNQATSEPHSCLLGWDAHLANSVT